MHQMRLGNTGIRVNRNGFGALPIQRIPMDEAARILRRAYDAGIDYYDTARVYTDSEEKIGYALADVRDKIYIASKTAALEADGLWRDLEESLKQLKTDYIDVYQLHNPPFCPKPGEDNGLYDAMLKAKEQGLIRHIAITNHRLDVAMEIVRSGLYEALQFPFSYLSAESDHKLVQDCAAAGMGFVAMKSLSGGLITNARAAYAYMAQHPSVLPIWGIQRMHELEAFLACADNPPVLDAALRQVIDADRKSLSGNFCRGCNYCAPCPAGIEIMLCARMSLFLRRAPSDMYLTEEIQEKMEKIADCLHCGSCAEKCPYGLDTPALLARNYADYREILAGKPL